MIKAALIGLVVGAVAAAALCAWVRTLVFLDAVQTTVIVSGVMLLSVLGSMGIGAMGRLGRRGDGERRA